MERGYLELSIVIALTPFRLLRLLAIRRLPALLDKIKFDLKSFRVILTYLSYIFFVFFVGHVAVCAWVYLSLVVQHKYARNFFVYKELGK